MTPTQRSIAELKKRGFLPYIVERWNPFAHIRQDLYGFIDIVGIKDDHHGVLAVQTTSGPHVAERIAKINAIPAAQTWLKAGNRIVVHGWRKVGSKGKRKLWELREVEITIQEVA
jgi:hypothetical protein